MAAGYDSFTAFWVGGAAAVTVVVLPFTFPTSFSVVRREASFNADPREATIIIIPNESSFDVAGE